MRAARAAYFLTTLLALPAAAQSPPFPAGTTQFFNTGVRNAVPADGGGVWVATSQGIVRYTAAGPGTVLTTPGGPPRLIARAADGSLWFATNTIGRISTAGTVLEQYPILDARVIAVASDGALWYTRGSLGGIVGRIAAGVTTEFTSPTLAGALAPAPAGEMWVLGLGFGTVTENLFRMSPAGAVTVVPLNRDFSFGDVQTSADGTVYAGGGNGGGLQRLMPGSQTPSPIAGFEDTYFLVEPDGDVWSGDLSRLGFLGLGSGIPRFSVPMPRDPRDCFPLPSYHYRPIALDSDGGLWVQIISELVFIGPVTCTGPPPPLPDLIRIDAATFLDTHTHSIPVLSPAMLIALTLLLAYVAVTRR